MATLTSQTIAGTYKDLLKIDATSYQAGIVSALRKVEDGDATASALSIGTVSIAIDATDKLYLDGGDDTYIHEASSNNFEIVVDDAVAFTALTGNDCALENTGKLYFDGGIHTYISETGTDVLDFYVGALNILKLNEENDKVEVLGANLEIDALKKFYLDGGTHTYIWESSADVISLVAGGKSVKIHDGTGASSNVVHGQYTGENFHASSSVNVFIGHYSGGSGTKTTDLDYNSCLGAYTGKNLTSGDENTFIGGWAGSSITTGTGNIGIGITTLCGDTGGVTVEAEPQKNVAVGNYSLWRLDDGDHNTALGYIAAQFITGGSTSATDVEECTFIGARCKASANDITNEIVIGYDAIGGGSNTCSIGNSSITVLMVDSDDNCDLGKADHQFDDVYYSGAINGSDLRMKDNIVDTPIGLGFINALRPVQYKWKDREQITEATKDITTHLDREDEVLNTTRIVQHSKAFKRKHHGLIAQEVKAVLDSQNINTNDFAGYVDSNIKDNVDRYSLRYTEFISPLIKAVQELSAKVTALENA